MNNLVLELINLNSLIRNDIGENFTLKYAYTGCFRINEKYLEDVLRGSKY